MKISILGMPGSGKGTQIEQIEKDFDVNVLSMGKVLRNISEKKTKLGKKIDKLIGKGKFVTSKLINKMILKKLRHKNIVFDGYPREIIEARFIDSKLKLDFVFLLNTSDKTAINHLKNRRACSCGMTYNLLTKKPEKNNICNRCGKKLMHREDDKPNTIKKRIEIYRKKTIPVVNHYRKKGILIEINANKAIKPVYEQIKENLNSLKN